MGLALLLLLLLLLLPSLLNSVGARATPRKSRPVRYMSNTELELELLDFTHRCGHISRLYSIGKSVNGTPLWVLEISDRPGRAEPEPAFKIVGNMHGDEPLGRELIVRLGDWLCSNYQLDPLAKLIIENVHLHLLPSMNPDGYANMSRNNANGVDLNRDFPDQFFPHNNDERRRQPETLAVMNWIRKTRFVASASLHEGAIVANYPWDGTADTSTKYSKCSDDATFRFLASIYSKAHRNMSKSGEFAGGITNGAAWYPLYGGMQDWSYIHGHCLELTLEISETKWPPANQITEVWENNRQSLLELIATCVRTGIHGRVQSYGTGAPLPATISVEGYNRTVVAGSTFGDYHRLLTPGKLYKVTASMAGYKSRTTSVVLDRNEAMTSLDFILSPSLEGNNEELIRMLTTNKSEVLPPVMYTLHIASICLLACGAAITLWMGLRITRRLRTASSRATMPKA